MTTQTKDAASATVASAPRDASLDRGGIAGHPKGLTTLFFTEMWERFSYYGMRAILILFMQAPAAAGGMGLDLKTSTSIYGLYTAGVYFMSIPGGWVADNLLGLRRAVLCGGILIAAGHYSLALNVRPIFFGGLALIVLGTGLLKANIAAIVGELYPVGDQRRDAGFSLFYTGINLGAFIAPLPVGYLAQRVGWHWGFGLAGVGMTLGLIQFVWGTKRLGGAGERLKAVKNPGRLWACVAAALVALASLLIFWRPWAEIVLLVCIVVGGSWWASRQGFSAEEKKRIFAIVGLFVFATCFWSGFEQAGSSLTLFADRLTRNVALGWEFPSSWWQSVNSFFVWTLAPVFAFLWMRLGHRGGEPSSLAKFALALGVMALSYFILALGATVSGPDAARVGPAWLLAVYFLHSVGELCLSPVGMSAVTKLSPARTVGLMMGVWYLSISLGNLLGSKVAGLFDSFPLPRLFGAVGGTMAACLLILLVATPAIRRLMGNVH